MAAKVAPAESVPAEKPAEKEKAPKADVNPDVLRSNAPPAQLTDLPAQPLQLVPPGRRHDVTAAAGLGAYRG
ncbi:hypothetical protein OG244_27715 [Streptomyces brevispora]|uniref:hypothetical protein n=1 Tax=Streptomyces brevispora TaxID=887462 RepID=UPI002E30AF99|nr:hypothetical protein [Streptomyces brevispora]